MFHRIGLVLGSHGEFNRGCARGIAAFARSEVKWIFNAIDLQLNAIPSLAKWEPEGVIGVLTDDELGDAIFSLGVPIVNTAKLFNRMDLPRVDHADVAIGRLAAGHFLERGFRQFGFAGLPVLPYALDRERGFRDAVVEAGFEVSVLHMVETEEQLRNASGWPEDEARVRAWLLDLQKPSAVMVCSDWHGWKVAEVCRDSGIRVPEDLALIGVDNDEPWCSLSHPPLSSVVVNSERIGYEAAALLQRILTGEVSGDVTPTEIPPVGIVTRRSSDTIAIEDADVASAVRFIRQHGNERLSVEDVLAASTTSRRSLERRFRRIIGRSIGEEVMNLRISRAKDLLVRTDLSMPQVARQSGFTNAKRFSESFRREVHLSPTEYRARYRPVK